MKHRLFNPVAPLQYWGIFFIGVLMLVVMLLVGVAPYPNKQRDGLIMLTIIGLPTFVSLRLAFWATRKQQIEQLKKRKLCLKCGYDLRATPDRCPECGTAVIATEAKA